MQCVMRAGLVGILACMWVGCNSVPEEVPADAPQVELTPKEVLFSATNEIRREHPGAVIIGLKEGQGATKEERLAAFRKLYALGESIDTTDEYNFTGLGYACVLGKLDVVKELLELKPDLGHGSYEPADDEEDCDCCVPGNYMPGYVALALGNGHKEVARYLLGCKAAPVGVGICLKNDDIDMLRELLRAGGSVHEAEHHDAPCTLDAKSPEMIRFLLANGCRKMSPPECLFRIRQRHDDDEKAENDLRRLFLESGCLSQRDIDAFDRGGLARFKGTWSMLSLPARGKKSCDENYYWSWLKQEHAWAILTGLADASSSAQDKAAFSILRRLPSLDVMEEERIYGACAWTMYLALRVVGDERFAAQIAKLSATQRKRAHAAMKSGIIASNDRMQHWAEDYPLTAQALSK